MSARRASKARQALAGVALLLAAFVAYVVAGLPARAEVRKLAKRNPDRTSVMKQRDREAQRAGRKHRIQKSWVPLSRMSRHLVHAVLASEDQKFFGHEGLDWEAIEKVIEEDRRGFRFSRGGSTITQQLAKNLYFTTDRTVTRKIKEAIVARWLEEELGKKRILELYLNVIEWGEAVFGAEAAARYHFGTSAAQLGAEQAARLAAMVPSPRRYGPDRNTPYLERRTATILAQMNGVRVP